MKDIKSLSVAILCGMLAIAAALPIAVKCYTNASRCVTVKGLYEEEVMADRAIWPIVYKQGGNQIIELAKKVEDQNAIIIKWLMDAGFSEDEITVAAPKVEDQKAGGYYTGRSFDYVMTATVTVCSDDVDKVVRMRAKEFDLLGSGIPIGSGNNWENPVQYEYTKLNDIKPHMIEQATMNARAAAAKFAKDSGSHVGKIITANQGQFSINDRDSNTPYRKIVRVVTTVTFRIR